MKRFGVLLLSLLAACQADQTGPRLISTAARTVSQAAANDDGPPSSYPFGPDTYRTRIFTGTGRQGLDCVSDLRPAQPETALSTGALGEDETRVDQI